MRSISIGMLCFFSSISTVSSYPVTYTIVYWYDVNVWHDLIFRFGLWCMHGSVCLCVFASDIYVDTSQEKKEFVQFSFFFIWLENRLRKKAKTAHTIMRCPRAYTQNHCIIIDAVPVCIMLLFHTWSFSFVFLLLIKLTWMLCFHICCCLLALFFYSSNRYTYLLCYIFFCPLILYPIESIRFLFRLFFFPFKVSRLLPQTACL